jgi:hypothetical protein
MFQRLDRHATLAMTKDVIANAVKQSSDGENEPWYRLPRCARSDGGGADCNAALAATNAVIARSEVTTQSMRCFKDWIAKLHSR